MKTHSPLGRLLGAVAAGLILSTGIAAQQSGMEDTNPRRADEGDGPHERLILRGGTYIDGAGSPPLGPVDIVVENDRIVEIRAVGFPMAPINEDRRPDGATSSGWATASRRPAVWVSVR